MRRLQLVVLVGILMLGVAEVAAKGKRNLHPSRNRTAQIIQKLNTPVDSVQWEAELFESLINDVFRGQFGLQNLLVDWKTIELSDSDIDRDTEISLFLTDTTVEELLSLVLEQVSLGAMSDEEELTYHIIGGMIKISTRDYFSKRLYIRNYSVEHLLQGHPMWFDAPQIRVDSTGQQGGGAGGGGSGPIFEPGGGGTGGGGGGQGGAFDFEVSREEMQGNLIELIKAHVRPGSWAPAGQATIRAFDDKLVIRQTIEAHEIIGGQFAYTRTLKP